MQVDEKCLDIIKQIILNKVAKPEVIQEKCQLSERQLEYRMRKINLYLKSEGLPIIQKSRQGTFVIAPGLSLHFNRLYNEVVKEFTLSVDERIKSIILLILSRNEEISLFHLSSTLKVSKNTILNDLKVIKKELEDYGLRLRYSRVKGYIIEGSEFYKRKAVIECIDKLIVMPNGIKFIEKLCNLFPAEVNIFLLRLRKIEKELGLKFTDSKMVAAPYSFAIIFRRIKSGKVINSNDIVCEELLDTKEYMVAKHLISDADVVPEVEVFYISLLLLSTNIADMEFLSSNDMPALSKAVVKMVEKFERNACIIFQEKETLIENLFQHIRPAYYRIKYNLTLSNKITDILNSNIQSNEFKETYRITKKAVLPLEQLMNTEIPEVELTFITLLFMGWLHRQNSTVHNKLRALVVCANGITVSRLMFVTLRDLLPEIHFIDSVSVREFMDYSLDDYDVVFSPNYLNTSKKLFLVNNVITAIDKEKIRNEVLKDLLGIANSGVNTEKVMKIILRYAEVRNYPKLEEELGKYLNNSLITKSSQNFSLTDLNLAELISIKHISILEAVEDWKEAVHKAAQPLLQEVAITEEYVDTIIANYNYDYPNIIFGKEIAVAHAGPSDGVNKLGMSLIKINHGVSFGKGCIIHIVIMLAPIDKKTHLRSLLQLSALSENQEDIDKIIEAKNLKTIIKVLENYKD